MNINRIANSLAGPELIWLLIYGVVLVITSHYQPATEAGNQRLESLSWLVIVIAVLLSFVPFWWAAPPRGWWWARTEISGLIGICVISSSWCGAIRYNDSRDSGVGTLFIMLVIFGFFLLVILSAGAALWLRFRR